MGKMVAETLDTTVTELGLITWKSIQPTWTSMGCVIAGVLDPLPSPAKGQCLLVCGFVNDHKWCGVMPKTMKIEPMPVES